MKYNLIGIDPSLVSTGLVVNGKIFNWENDLLENILLLKSSRL